jgi:hypothetical protein
MPRPEQFTTEQLKQTVVAFQQAKRELVALQKLNYEPVPGTLAALDKEIHHLADLAAAGVLLDRHQGSK